jgi:hypothetical protein
MAGPTYTFKTALWKYPGDGAWYFITVPGEFAGEIRTLAPPLTKGFGSIKVTAAVNGTAWQTSIFPDKKSGSYLMPVKKEIRAKLQIGDGDELDVSVTLEV